MRVGLSAAFGVAEADGKKEKMCARFGGVSLVSLVVRGGGSFSRSVVEESCRGGCVVVGDGSGSVGFAVGSVVVVVVIVVVVVAVVVVAAAAVTAAAAASASCLAPPFLAPSSGDALALLPAPPRLGMAAPRPPAKSSTSSSARPPVRPPRRERANSSGDGAGFVAELELELDVSARAAATATATAIGRESARGRDEVTRGSIVLVEVVIAAVTPVDSNGQVRRMPATTREHARCHEPRDHTQLDQHHDAQQDHRGAAFAASCCSRSRFAFSLNSFFL